MKETSSKRKATLTNLFTSYTFLTPMIIILGIFTVSPIVYAIFLSFYKVKLLGGMEYSFIGVDNFTRMIDDARVWIALKNTAQYVLIVVPSQTVLALILAVALNSKIKGKNIFRSIYFLPTVTSSAVLTLIFMWMYNSQGLFNKFLSLIGLPTYNWIGDPAVALKAIMLMNIWSTAPFYMVIYLAALQDIPDTLYEAAEIDGGGWWHKLWYITVPMLKPVTSFVVIIGIIGTFQLFDQSYIFSGGSGGPNNSTLSVVLLIYQYAFKSVDMGYAAALAVMLATVIMIATLLQRRFSGEQKEEGGTTL